MVFRIFQKWFRQRRNQESVLQVEAKPQDAFSPLTYQNPCILYMNEIIERVLSQKKMTYQKLELVVFDAEGGQEQDEEDIRMVLYELEQRLNYLLLVTDRPDRYEVFIEQMYEENGLIVQQLSKSARRQAKGNLVLDFERSGGMLAESEICSGAVCLPIYKRPWEISENLDILVPVGYNTLVVEGIFPPDWEESRSMHERFVKDKMIDRLDREFRKG